MRLKKGDTVVVIAGDDSGKTGKVLKVFPDKNRAIVEGVNFIKRHTRQTQRAQKGGIVEKEGTIHVSNLRFFCPRCSTPSKTTRRTLEPEGGAETRRVRICKRCGEII
ncbi:MAG: 50S ribosomal protein L24 [Candidatus Zixiibacteriota bacterium]